MTNNAFITMTELFLSKENKQNSKTGLIVLLGVAALGIGLYFLSKSNKEKEKMIERLQFENEKLENINANLLQEQKEQQQVNEEIRREIFANKKQDEK